MTIQQLEYLVALDKHRHFVSAANACFVTQPTLTMQLKKLEDEIGIQLFNRNKSPLTPTPEGKEIISKAKSILLEINQLKEMVNKDRNNIDGTYTLGIIPTLAPYLLPEFIKNFGKLHPKTKLIINELKSEHIIEQLKKGQLDIGIMATPTLEKDLREIPLYNEPFIVFAAEGHITLKRKNIDLKQLKNDDLWLLAQGHCFRNQVLELCNMINNNSIQYESGSIESLKNIVITNNGYTLLPAMAIDYKKEANNIRELKTPKPSREVSLVVHKGFVKEALLAELRNTILEQIPDEYKSDKGFKKLNWR